MARRLPLLSACAVVLAGVGVAVTLRPATNPGPASGATSTNSESTALYCTGLEASAHRPGRVTYLNTANASRSVQLQIVSDTGHVVSRSVELAAHAQYSLQPTTLEGGTFFAVSARFGGAGVVAAEVTGDGRAAAPCASVGVTSWSAGGFSTKVGSSAFVSVYNPTATSAVFNTSVFTAAGFAAPQAYQGVSVPAHAEKVLNLSGEVVNTSGAAVALKVLRGSLVVVGVEDDQGVTSLNPGQVDPLRRAYFPAVTTADRASAALDVANPGPNPAEVTVRVHLGKFRIHDQHLTVAPYTTGSLTLTPNPAIPAAGYAALSVHSNVPVVIDLATGSGGGLSLSAPSVAQRRTVLHDFTSRGFDAVRLFNPGRRSVTVRVRALGATSGVSLHVSGQSALDLAGDLHPALRGDVTYVLRSTGEVVVGQTLPSQPAGVVVLDPLNGG